jgi:lambda family phage portal protein
MSILVGAIVDNPPSPRRRAEPTSPLRRPTASGPMATYDAAGTSDENRKHWSNADSLSAVWANSPGVRRVARNRTRYERANNGYLKNAIKTARNDIVGRAPRRQSTTGNAEHDAWIDAEFAAWCKAIGFGWKFRTAACAFKGDGEAVGVWVTNPKLPTAVKADVKLIEAEQLASPLSIYDGQGNVKDRFGVAAEYMADGVLFDAAGNVTEYHVLNYHPGDGYNTDPLAFTRYAPEYVMHWFERDRPGQVRGMPDTMTALPLCAMLRRFTLASLQAAEVQASIAGVLETDALPGGRAGDDPETRARARHHPSLPGGYDFKGVDATQPTAMYGDFKREVLSEQAVGMGMPYNQVARDSSRHNYSSARLDTQERQDDVDVERCDAEEFWAEPHFNAWRREAALIPGYAPEGLDLSQPLPGQWHWKGWGYIDPVKEITATTMALEANLTSLKREYAKQGLDWKAEIDQIAEEQAYLKTKGLTPASVNPAAAQAVNPDTQDAPDAPGGPPAPAEPPPQPAPARRRRELAWTR